MSPAAPMDLPEPGTCTLVEASAGTGKTWQVADTVLRQVAEAGVEVGRIVLVTYTRAATAELRDRVRGRLASARDALATEGPQDLDPTLDRLCADPADRATFRARVRRALRDFDELWVSTIHGFCQRILVQYGSTAGMEPPRELGGSARRLRARVLSDVRSGPARWDDPARAWAMEVLGWNASAYWEDVERLASRLRVPKVEDPPPPEGTLAHRWLAELLPEAGPTPPETAAAATLGAVAKLRDGVASWVREDPCLADLAGPGLQDPGGSLSAEVCDAVCRAASRLRDAAVVGPGASVHEAAAAFDTVVDVAGRRLFAWVLEAVHGGVRAELRRAGLLTYDEMLVRLAEVLDDPVAGPPLLRAVQARHPVAIVDEFQDTDGVQWSILSRLFVHPGGRLVLVGDPKQAIYGFRGAEIRSYQAAAAAAGRRVRLGRNFRSDGPLLHALEHLYGPGSGAFGRDVGFDFQAVEPDPRRRGWGLVDGPPVPEESGGRRRRPLEVRVYDRDPVEPCADEVAALLAGRTKVWPEDGKEVRLLTPRDIAVLVYRHDQAVRIQRALRARGVRAVRAAVDSVFTGTMAAWLADLVEAIGSAGAGAAARRVAAGPFGGLSAVDLARLEAGAEGDGDGGGLSRAARRWTRFVEALSEARKAWDRHGFGRALDRFLEESGALARVVALPDGERLATDLRHLAELCHLEQRRARLSPEAVARFLRSNAAREASRGAAGDRAGDDASLVRLESDEDAVQIATVWASKGLTYGVVFLPFAPVPREAPGCFAALDPDTLGSDGVRYAGPLSPAASVAAVKAGDAGGGTGWCTARAEALVQARARGFEDQVEESLRLLYVSLTRARHHVVVFVRATPFQRGAGARRDPLRFLLARSRDHRGRPVPTGRIEGGLADVGSLPGDGDGLWERLVHLAATSAGTVGAARVAAPWYGAKLAPEAAAPRDLARRPVGAVRVPRDFQVASFSSWVGRFLDAAADEEPLSTDEWASLAALSAGTGMGGRRWASPPPVVERTALDEGYAVLPEREAAGGEGPPVNFVGLPAGRRSGTMVHGLLEALDFVTGTVDGASAEEAAAAALVQTGFSRDLAPGVAAGLARVLATPLGGVLGLPEDFRLGRLDRADRLDEFAFDLSLGAGAAYRLGERGLGRRLDAAGFARALRKRLTLDPDFDGCPWVERAASAGLEETAGILTGSIDLVFRVFGRDGPRFYLVDYKTNRLLDTGSQEEAVERYDRASMAAAMAHHGYYLQGLLYTVALHRFLRDRVPGYDYDRHVGGYLYLFLRGMTGPDAPACGSGGAAQGVYADRWPREVVEGVDAAFDGDGLLREVRR